MSRTTTALKRLGVPGIAAVTMVAGLPLFLGTASAAHINRLELTPESTNEAAGVCVPFTAQLVFNQGQNPRVETIDVEITEASNAPAAQDITFCTAPTNGVTPATPRGATADGGTDRAEFTTDANGRVTFGIVSNTSATTSSTSNQTLTIRAFYEVDGSPNNNNRFDAGEFTDTSTATFTAGGAPNSNANQDAARDVEVVAAGEPASSTSTATITNNNDTDSVVEGETRTYRVAVRGANGERLAGVTVSFSVASSSSDSAATRGPATFGVTDNDGIATGSITFPVRTGTADTQDTVTFFVNQSNGQTAGRDQVTTSGGEPADTLVVTVRDAGGQQNRTITLTPESETFTGTERSATFTAIVDDPRTTGADSATAGTLVAFTVTGGSGDETVVVNGGQRTSGGFDNECTTVTNTAGTDANDSRCDITVNDPTPTTGQVLTVTANIRGTSQSDTSTLTFVNRPQDARFIALTPETVTVAPNTAQQLVATVTDVDGRPVRGVEVTFTETGAGAFRNGSSTVVTTTDANGRATVETLSLPGETGTQTVTATITTTGTQCSQRANQGTDPQGNALNSTNNTGAAGVCADSSTVTFGAASPSPSASATPTAGTTSPSPSNTASPGTPPGCQVAAARLERTTITATGSSGVTVTAAPNSVVELFAYTRPSTTFRLVRSAEVGADGVAEFRITPPANTRLQARQQGCAFGQSIVLNVRTAISLIVKRNGPRLYTFSGDSLPARPGGLIVSLFRVTNDGRQILTAQVRANSQNGEYSITRRFTGSGRFGFVVRTGQDLQNAPGSSNVRSLAVF